MFGIPNGRVRQSTCRHIYKIPFCPLVMCKLFLFFIISSDETRSGPMGVCTAGLAYIPGLAHSCIRDFLDSHVSLSAFPRPVEGGSNNEQRRKLDAPQSPPCRKVPSATELPTPITSCLKLVQTENKESQNTKTPWRDDLSAGMGEQYKETASSSHSPAI